MATNESDLTPAPPREIYETLPIRSSYEASIPPLYTTWPFLRDELETESSELQDDTVEDCLPWLRMEGMYKEQDLNSHGIPSLRRAKHIRFLQQSLKLLPKVFVALDASRPWLIYWSLNGLSMLGSDLEAQGVFDYTTRAILTLASCQTPDGGFGGSSHQLPHLACSYAAVLTICLVGSEEAYNMVDRRAMWQFLCRMKQPDGGFTMCAGGEEDVRGAFCAVVIAALLDLPLEISAEEKLRLRSFSTATSPPPSTPSKGFESLTDGLASWISRCQNFEGGLGGAPGNEAHGAYAFCGLGALSILGPPHETIPANLDAERLLAWLAARQHAPEGGFDGRANKLVDGCYSHWVGGCWALLEAALAPSSASFGSSTYTEGGPGSLWDREGLARYTLCCAQNPSGGLRDKPGKGPDAYHTCYNLAGLGWATYRFVWVSTGGQGTAEAATAAPASVSGVDNGRGPLNAAFQWRVAGRSEEALPLDDQDLVAALHPVFVVSMDRVARMREFFARKQGF